MSKTKPKPRRFAVRLQQDHYTRIQQIAETENKTQSAVLRAMIEQYTAAA